MKVAELFEAYTPPVANKKLGFNTKAKIPIGGSKEWLKAFGANAEHVEHALRNVRQSAAYRRVKSLGMTDESKESHNKNGSIMFVGLIQVSVGEGKLRNRRMKLTIQPNGKIDETQPNDIHRAPMATGKPRIIPGDPVGSIQKTVEAALDKMADNLVKRRAREEKDIAAAKKFKSVGVSKA